MRYKIFNTAIFPTIKGLVIKGLATQTEQESTWRLPCRKHLTLMAPSAQAKSNKHAWLVIPEYLEIIRVTTSFNSARFLTKKTPKENDEGTRKLHVLT